MSRLLLGRLSLAFCASSQVANQNCSALRMSTKSWNIVYKRLRNPTQWQSFQRINKTSGKGSFVFVFSRTVPLSLGLSFAPFSNFRKNLFEHKDACTCNELSQEILDHIPKDVFKKDPPRKKKVNFVMRVIWAIWEPIAITLRFFRITFTYLPLLIVYPLTLTSERFRLCWWNWLLKALERTGPTFIKLGQWASTRRDLFSAELCDLFSKLHDHTVTHSWFMTKNKLKKAFGKRWKEVFIKIEKKPIGSGCIAQVHRAYMRANMVPDESIVEEMLSMEEEEDGDSYPWEIDFAEGLEVVGFGSMHDDIDDYIEQQETMKQEKLRELLAKELEKQKQKEQQEAEAEIRAKAEAEGVPYEEVDTTYVNEDGGGVEGEEGEEEPILPVAVKVVHPGIYRQVQRDLTILRLVARFAEFCIPSFKWLSLSECVEEFSVLMTKQIDLRYEAKCMDKFGENFEDVPNIRFPRTIRPYCKRDVMIQTYEDGIPIIEFLKDHEPSDNEEENQHRAALKEKLASYGIEALLQMVFTDNFVHGDLHPGNILVMNAHHFTPQEENKLMLVDVCDTVIVNVVPVENPLRLILLDTGITTSLSEQDLQNFRDVFTAVVLGEGEKVAELMLLNSSHSECKNVPKFKEELSSLVNRFREETIKLGKVQVGDLLSKVFRIMSQHRVKMESNFASVVLAIFVLEGIGRSLDPDLDILEKAKPILLGSHD